MSTTLTKHSDRVALAMRLASRLRDRRPGPVESVRNLEGVVRTRLARDGSLVGRSVLTLPFDL